MNLQAWGGVLVLVMAILYAIALALFMAGNIHWGTYVGLAAVVTQSLADGLLEDPKRKRK